MSLTEGPDRPTRFEAVQGDFLVFHFPAPVDAKPIVRFRSLRKSVRRAVARRDEYSVGVSLPERIATGPWQIDIEWPTGAQTYRVPIMTYVHSRPN